MRVPSYIKLKLDVLKEKLNLPDLDLVNNETDILQMVIRFELKLTYCTRTEHICYQLSNSFRSRVQEIDGKWHGPKPPHPVYIVTNDPQVPVEVMRANAVCNKILELI